MIKSIYKYAKDVRLRMRNLTSFQICKGCDKMDNYSILSPNKLQKDQSDVAELDFFDDLNLDQIVNAIFQMKREYDLKEMYYHLPRNKITIRYRQEILMDMEQSDIFDAFHLFAEEIKNAKIYMNQRKELGSEVQSDRLMFDSLLCYNRGIKLLDRCFEQKQYKSEGLNILHKLLINLQTTIEYKTFEEELLYFNANFQQMRICVTIQDNSLKITTGDVQQDYCRRFHILFPNYASKVEEKEHLVSPFHFQRKLCKFEELSTELYKKKEKELFSKLKKFSKRYEEFMEPWILELEREVQFYLAFLLFAKKYEMKEYPFSFPKIVDTEDLYIQDGYDLALFMKNLYSNVPVVKNDISYMKTERFMVVTGPNQGGKTTFARSIGQIIYFSLIGLKAPCSKAIIPEIHKILTHFSVEESLETGRGKLKEELIRLAPMMKNDCERSFVIINELFTTAASIDAYVMGKRVMEFFIRHNCYGIYVTHIQELANVTEQIISLSACVDETDQKKRTYKISRRQAEGHGYANDLVEKYQLSYFDIKRRLEDEGIPTISESRV